MPKDKAKADADRLRDKDGHFVAKDAAPKTAASGKASKPSQPAPKAR